MLDVFSSLEENTRGGLAETTRRLARLQLHVMRPLGSRPAVFLAHDGVNTFSDLLGFFYLVFERNISLI